MAQSASSSIIRFSSLKARPIHNQITSYKCIRVYLSNNLLIYSHFLAVWVMLGRLPLDLMTANDADSNTSLDPILCISGTKVKERNSWVRCVQEYLTVPNSFTPSLIFPPTAPDLQRWYMLIGSLGLRRPLSMKNCSRFKFKGE